ncbi:MAG: LacI family DNA-binding transcriptional regulator [Streptosporangiaceae bacterium]
MPRLLDVANVAGVSLRTASRVLNDDPRVAADTRQRVRAAIDELSFSPDAMARSLRAGTDTAIGFVVESIADPFFAAVIDAVEELMSKHGRSVLVASARRDAAWERDVVERMLRRRVAGLLLSPSGGSHAWLAPTSPDGPGAPSVPVVLVDRPALDLTADLVEIDDHRAAFDATAHLIAHGHQRIAYVGDTPAIATSAARLRGYRDALREHGLPVDEHLVRCDCDTSEDAARAVPALLGPSPGSPHSPHSPHSPRSQDRPPTAILSATIRASLGVVPALHAAGRTDVALVGFGDFPMAGTLRPAITVVDHPGREVGRAAATRLLARLADPGLPAERIQVPARIVPRGSGELCPP